MSRHAMFGNYGDLTTLNLTTKTRALHETLITPLALYSMVQQHPGSGVRHRIINPFTYRGLFKTEF